MKPTRPATSSRPATVEAGDCPECRSAGSVRRGVCDICGSHLGGADAPPAAPLVQTTRPLVPGDPGLILGRRSPRTTVT
jgi:hypothetical protein